jgi:hypothetical protein
MGRSENVRDRRLDTRRSLSYEVEVGMILERGEGKLPGS